jgi:hypothetical protein
VKFEAHNLAAFFSLFATLTVVQQIFKLCWEGKVTACELWIVLIVTSCLFARTIMPYTISDYWKVNVHINLGCRLSILFSCAGTHLLKVLSNTSKEVFTQNSYSFSINLLIYIKLKDDM